MRLSTLVILVCLLPFGAAAADLIPKSAPHCGVELPPATSGENSTHAILIKVFPRKASVGNDYTGCQTMWIQRGIDWEKFSVMHFVQGKLQVWWSAEDTKDSPGLYCRFSNGKLLAGEPSGCYEPAYTGLSASYESGCEEAAIRLGKMSEKCRATLEH